MQQMWKWARAWRGEAALCAAMCGALWLLAALFRQDATHISYAAHFVEQARSWLHGRMDVPAWLGHDLVRVGPRDYIVYPPAPALLMLPFVALLGAHFSDIWFSWLAAALNVALLYHLLNALVAAGWLRRTARENAIIASTFGLGTIALWLALGGTVWFVAQTLAVTFTIVLLLGVVRRQWWLASAALGALFLTRTPDALGAIVLGAALLWHSGPYAVGDSGQECPPHAGPHSPHTAPSPRRRGVINRAPTWWPTALRRADGASNQYRPLSNRPLFPSLAITRPSWSRLAAAIIPFAVAVGIWLVRNQLYFGHPLSSGYDLQIQQDYPQIKYGLLSWHYVWPNFVADFLNMPAFTFRTPYDLTPLGDLLRGGNGTSVFFTTPLFLLFFLPARSTAPAWLRAALWLTVAGLVIFVLFWNLTGWYQAGARYLFDAYPYLFALLAMRGDRLGWRWLALACMGAMVNLGLANAFWCHNGACLGNHLTARWLAFGALLAALPVGYAAAWWWLRRETPATPETATPATASHAHSPPAS
jgi:hypothetical protein